jgi:hypothetical protein
MKTLRDVQEFDATVEAYMHPESPETDRIGQLCRSGKAIYYAFIDDIYHEASDRLTVARKIANHVTNN